VSALAEGLRGALSRTWDETAIARSRGRSWEVAARELFEIGLEVMASSKRRV
jgi:hypothetical protein